MKQKSKIILVFILFFILASVKYFYQFKQRTIFEYDQEYLAQQAKLILIDKKLSLIGAPTSVGGMFIGPFYNYFVSLAFGIAKMSPYALAFITNAWAVLTLIFLFVINKKKNSLWAGIFSFLLALGSFQFLNQTALPPLLFPLPLISLLLFYLLMSTKINFLVLGLLVGLAFNLHFTAFFFIPMIILSFFIKPIKHFKILNFFELFGPIFIFCLPLLFFDLRHNFFLTKNFFAFLSQKNDLPFNFLSQFGHSLIISLENMNSLFSLNLLKLPKIVLPLFFILFFLFKTEKKLSKLTLLWLLSPILLFSFYKGHIINYYFVLQEPIFLLVVGSVLAYFFKRPLGKILVIAFLSLMFFSNFKVWYHWRPDPSLYFKMKAFEFIKEKVGDKPFYLSYTVDSGRQGGYDYLTFYYHFNLVSKPDAAHSTYTLIYPHFWHGIKSDYIFGTIGVGIPKNE